MGLRYKLDSSRYITIVFIVSLLFLFFIANVSYRQVQSLNASEKLVIHSHEVHNELEQILSYLKDAETGQRGYFITKDTIYLEPYRGARQNVNKSYIRLKSLAVGNKEQQRNLDTLFTLINKRFAWLVMSFRLSKAEFSKSSEFIKQMYEGRIAMDQIRAHIDKMIKTEMKVLESREEEHRIESAFTPFASLILMLFSLLIFTFSFYKIHKDRRELKKLNEQLLSRNKELELQILDDFSSSFAVYKTGDEFFNSLAFDLAFKTKLDYVLIGKLVHETTTENGIKSISFTINGKQAENISFPLLDGPWEQLKLGNLVSCPKDCKRMYPKNKLLNELNVEAYVGYPLFGTDGKLMGLIALMHKQEIKDISYIKSLLTIAAKRTELEFERISYQRTLEISNFELEKQNTELASFNHVASHDLQEPLRKIQIFISRISDTEFENLPDTVKDYFSRIRASANRMQLLIDDLLMFSRTNKSDEVFQLTDLNTLLENTKVEFHQTIEESNAKIISDLLPKLPVIPFQFQQLLNNVIGNSLKYAKADVPPVIEITCETVPSREVPEARNFEIKQYYKIEFKDNGIGFEQEHAKNIFVLFQRLHGKNEYSGTGIGLTICKKIVENHKGFITANSEPDEGATFTVFLPKT